MPAASWTRIDLLKPLPDSPAPEKPGRREILLLGALLIPGLLLRACWANALPLNADEIHYAYDFVAPAETDSLRVVRDVSCAFLVERRTAHPALVSLLTRWLWFAPLDPFVPRTAGFLRGFNVLCGTLLIPVAWIAARLIWGVRHGLLAAFFVAASPLLAWVSRTTYLDAPYALFIGLFLVFAILSARSHRWQWCLASGVAAGLAASCKISGALIGLPLLLAAFAAPAGTPRRSRILRAGGCLIASAVTWFLLCSPEAYFSAILTPTDPRVSRFAAYSTWVFFLTELQPYRLILLLGAPLTLLLLPFICIPAIRRQMAFGDVLLIVSTLAFLPLLVLHTPSFSGPHGLAPLLLICALLSSRIVEFRLHLTVPLGVLHLALAAAGFVEPARPGLVPFGLPGGGEFAQGHRELRPYLADDDSHPRIAITSRLPAQVMPFANLMRSAILAEGAVFLLPASDADAFNPGPWEMADAVFVSGSDSPANLQAPSDFRRLTNSSFPGGSFFVRVSGTRTETFAVSELTPLDASGAYLPPMGYYPLTGHLELNGVPLPRQDEATAGAASHDGFRNALQWGSGRILPGEAVSPSDRISFGPPQVDDVFWDF
ncbi:MAG: Dolichyl-phosphate-mannose-protein mannosyltransferase [Candidatus Sumerlaeota bacterium]|nr:Dolichyl-phosphate-mannose-protein mannosyltransferase [Candidatus Sumerlaeota bacterium]